VQAAPTGGNRERSTECQGAGKTVRAAGNEGEQRRGDRGWGLSLVPRSSVPGMHWGREEAERVRRYENVACIDAGCGAAISPQA